MGADRTSNLEIARGRSRRMGKIHQFGEAPNLPNDPAFSVIWPPGGPYTGFNPTTAGIVEVFSDNAADSVAGAGAKRVQLLGLRDDYTFIENIVTLHATDGTIAVDSEGDFLRLNRMFLRALGGVKNTNLGTITARMKSTPTDVMAVMRPGTGAAEVGAWTVPADKKAFATRALISMAGLGNAGVVARLVGQAFGQPFQIRGTYAIGSGRSSNIEVVFDPPAGPFNQKTDIWIEASADSPNTGVSGQFSLIITDD